MPATLSDVAAQAGVSISAVSRVLANAPSARVRPETRLRIQQAAKDLGYRPNHAGRALKLARSNVIALVVPDVTNAIFTELMRGVEDAAIEQDYTVLLGRSEDMQPGGDMISKLIGEGRIDGLLLQLAEDVEPDDVVALLDPGSPVVFVNTLHDGLHSSVSLPNALGAQRATGHLIALGHERIGMIGGSRRIPTSGERERGFRAAMDAAGLPVEARLLTDLGYSADQGRAAMRRLVEQGGLPTAVFVANLNAAIGALAEARALGIGVPQELSIATLHDAWTAENTWPPLTTVRMPLYELGRNAIDLVIRRLAGGEPEDVYVTSPEPELVVRESTTAPGV